MNADFPEPSGHLAEYHGREAACSEIIELLKEKAISENALWAPHLPQIIDAVQFYQGLLRDEIDHFGERRYHEFQPDEVLDFIDEDLDRLAKWLARMTNTELPVDAEG